MLLGVTNLSELFPHIHTKIFEQLNISVMKLLIHFNATRVSNSLLTYMLQLL